MVYHLEKQSIDLESMSTMSSPTHLDDQSIEAFFAELDTNHAGCIDKITITNALLNVYKHLAPSPKPYHLIHPSRAEDLQFFIDSLFTEINNDAYDLRQFKALVRAWNLPAVCAPSTDSSGSKEPSRSGKETWSHYMQRTRTRCNINAPRYLFILTVFFLQLGMFLWVLFIFFKNKPARAAFGTGMLVAKAASGALYPTLTLMVFSMSRWTQMFLRKSKHLRRFVDWEYARNFHIKMACLAFLLGIIHAIAHITGTYRYALHHPEALALQIWRKPGTPVPTTYLDFMKWRASWTGWFSLGFFTIMSVCGSPKVRKRSFELFQWSHLLMYPLFAMLLIHGSSAILKNPILGWWMLLPILLVICEKLYRLMRGFIPMQATVTLAEDNMVALSIRIGKGISRYRPGQYVFLQVPSISRFQWHPFTVSKIDEDSIMLHIRTSAGDWTSALLKESIKSKTFVTAIDGPYGAPSREFYKYDNTVIFGAGIGITPFSAILFDLFDKLSDNKSPWKEDNKNVQQHVKREDKQFIRDARRGSQASTVEVKEIKRPDTALSMSTMGDPTVVESLASFQCSSSSSSSSAPTLDSRHLTHLKTILQKRSVSLHWTVRNCQDLQWLSLLLNQLSSDLSVRININLYVTQSNQDLSMSTLIFRSLLDHKRIDSLQKTSFLTGLHQTCHFARPNLNKILDDYQTAYSCLNSASSPRKVGVIYCGPVNIGNVLASKCEMLTGQARAQGSQLRFFYHSESF